MAEKKEINYPIYRNNVGEEIVIVFLDGKSLKGILRDILRYELIIEHPEKGNVAVFKHAIKYIY